MKHFTSKTQKSGEIGENIAEMFLVKHGYRVLDRNMTQKWGEIDIIAEKSGVLHFIEVKMLKQGSRSWTNGFTNPFENITPIKMEKIKRTVESWISSSNVSRETPFQIDGIAVIYDPETKQARVKLLQNINI